MPPHTALDLQSFMKQVDVEWPVNTSLRDVVLRAQPSIYQYTKIYSQYFLYPSQHPNSLDDALYKVQETLPKSKGFLAGLKGCLLPWKHQLFGYKVTDLKENKVLFKVEKQDSTLLGKQKAVVSG